MQYNSFLVKFWICQPVTRWLTRWLLSSPQNYTQYIPLSIYDLQAWMGSPSIYIYDCSHAGM